jgi:flagellar hook-length control protein FliK
MIVAGAPQVSLSSAQQTDPASTVAAPEAGETDFAALLFLMIGTSQPSNNPSAAGSGDNVEAADGMPISESDEEADLTATDCAVTQPSNPPDPAQSLPLGTSPMLQGAALGTTEDPAADSSLPGSAMPRGISGLQLSALPVSNPAALSDEAEPPPPAADEAKAPPAQTAQNEFVDSEPSIDAQPSRTGEEKAASPKQVRPGSSSVHALDPKEPSAVPHPLSPEAIKNSEGAAVDVSAEAVAASPVVSPEASGAEPGPVTTPAVHRIEGANHTGRSDSRRERGTAEDMPGFGFGAHAEAENTRRGEAVEFGSSVLAGEHKHAEPVEIKGEPSFRLNDTAVSMLNTTGSESLADKQTVGAREWRPVIGRVATEIAAQLRIGQNEAVIQLDPPDLGKIKIDLHVRGDKLQAHIIAEAQESHALIENHLQELRQALQAQSVDLVDVRVSHGGVTGGGDPMAGFRQQSNGGQETSWTSAHGATAASESSETRRQGGSQREAGRVSVWA